jgi:hypothetical protein
VTGDPVALYLSETPEAQHTVALAPGERLWVTLPGGHVLVVTGDFITSVRNLGPDSGGVVITRAWTNQHEGEK